MKEEDSVSVCKLCKKKVALKYVSKHASSATCKKISLFYNAINRVKDKELSDEETIIELRKIINRHWIPNFSSKYPYSTHLTNEALGKLENDEDLLLVTF